MDIIPYNYNKFKDGEMIVELKKLLDEMMYGMIFIIPFLIFKNNSLYHFVLCNKNMIKLRDEIKRANYK